MSQTALAHSGFLLASSGPLQAYAQIQQQIQAGLAQQSSPLDILESVRTQALGLDPAVTGLAQQAELLKEMLQGNCGDNPLVLNTLLRSWTQEVGAWTHVLGRPGSSDSVRPSSRAPLSRRRSITQSLAPVTDLVPALHVGKLQCNGCLVLLEPKPDDKCCSKCGTPFREDIGLDLQPQNKRVTILFTDFKGFTQMSNRLGAEELFRWLNYEFNVLGAEIKRQGGWFVKNIGDAIMAVFGAPYAYEDHAVRGVRAATRMLQILDRLNPQLEARGLPALEMRIGVHTGQVAVGYLGGPDSKKYDVIGMAVNMASRMESFKQDAGASKIALPDGNRILVSDATFAELQGRFTYQDIDRVAFKGVEGKVGVYWIKGEVPGSQGIVSLQESDMPFHGRQPQLAQLENSLTNVLAGTARVTVAVGEAGSGKSRLLAEYIHRDKRLAQAEVKVAAARGVDRNIHPPYYLLSQALRNLAGVEAVDLPGDQEIKIRSLTHVLSNYDESQKEWLAQLLGRLMGLGFSLEDSMQERIDSSVMEMRRQVAENIESMTSDERVYRENVTRALVDFTAAYTEVFPLMFVLEDLHWADEFSLKVLSHLVSELPHARLSILGAARPSFTADYHKIFQSAAALPLVELGEIDSSGLAAMTSELISDYVESSFRSAAVNFILEQAQGNLFFLHEMVQATRAGWLQRDVSTDGWNFVSEDGTAVTPGSQNFLQARLDRLAAGERDLIEIASIVGGTVDLDLLHDLGIDDAEIHLGRLELEQVLVKAGSGNYRIRHDMMRETCLKVMSSDRRRELHRDVAALYQRWGDKPLSVVAHHLSEAGNLAMASRVFFDAGMQAKLNGAPDQGMIYFQEASRLGRELVPAIALSAELEINGHALDVRDFERAYGALRAATLLLDVTMDRGHQAQYYYNQARTYLAAPDEKRGISRPTAIAAVNQGLSLFDADEPEAMQVQLLALKGRCYTEGRYFEEGREYIEAAVRMAKILDDKDLIADSYLNQMYLGLQYGDYASVIQLAEEVDSLLTSPRFAKRRLVRNVNLGGAYINLGYYQEALELYQATEELSLEKFGGAFRVNFVPNIGTSARLLGQHELAMQELDRCVQLYGRHANEFMAGVTHLYRALTLNALQRYPEAVTAALRVEAIANAGEEADPKLAAMAHMAFAQIYLAQRQLDEALRRSHLAYDLLRESNWMVEEFDLEIMLTHARILSAAGEAKAAWQVMDGAMSEYHYGTKRLLGERAERLSSSEQRDSFNNRVAVNFAIGQLWESLREQNLLELDHDSVTALSLQMVDQVRPGHLGPEWKLLHEAEPAQVIVGPHSGSWNTAFARTTLPPVTLLNRLITARLDLNPMTTSHENLMLHNGIIRASRVSDSIYFDWNFELFSPDAALVQAITTVVNVGPAMTVRYQDEWHVTGSVVRLNFKANTTGQPFNSHQFGDIELMIGVNTAGESLLQVRMQQGTMTQQPEVLLQAVLDMLQEK